MILSRRPMALLGTAVAVAAVLPAAAQTADDRAVAHAVESLTRAMLNPDRAALDALAHDALSYGHSAGRIETKAQFVDNLVSRSNPFGEINISDQTIAIVGDQAIVRHNFTGNTTGGGRVTPVRIGILQVWTKQGSNWRLLARQAFVRPPA
ncbi:nuclear transport factor 2 family protein [Roseococcus pinisoli]|uniref:Nuclear transport factor 2 family protein n=1 Tax=Roseococcus pinisoli TaxID=2835040 RepID=A0ABS5Q846_9PROT|nr:nuclear transport factor 2 family protein [Roseococcus pinisoli]MBS7809573.1 nuclear transport factor 2 family protein [Roseococcus pinisoli]